MRQRRQAFTLIELLVVIAIIAILAAILFPVFAQAKAAAKASACLSNTKQLGLGLMQYTSDNDGVYPGGWFVGIWPTDPASVQNGRYKWMDAIYPYVKNADIFTCPSSQFGDDGKYIPRDRLTGATERRWGSYALNTAYWGSNDSIEGPVSDMGQRKSSSDTSVEDIAGTILMGDDGYRAFQIAWENIDQQPTKVLGKGDMQYIHISDRNYDDTCCQYEGALFFRHSNRANIAFTDGHSKSITAGQALKQATTGPNNNGKYPLAMFTSVQD
jgi:prepilin-type N-terminal cleavage/methylation domain-containing protein/prepilin-type processing-associated H-X9-DG protein